MTWRWMCNCSVLNPAMCLLSGHIHVTVPSHTYTEPLCFYCLPVTIHTPTNYALIPSTSTRHLLLRYPTAHILLLPFTVNGRMWKRGSNTNWTDMDTHCSLATNTHSESHTLLQSESDLHFWQVPMQRWNKDGNVWGNLKTCKDTAVLLSSFLAQKDLKERFFWVNRSQY